MFINCQDLWSFVEKTNAKMEAEMVSCRVNGDLDSNRNINLDIMGRELGNQN